MQYSAYGQSINGRRFPSLAIGAAGRPRGCLDSLGSCPRAKRIRRRTICPPRRRRSGSGTTSFTRRRGSSDPRLRRAALRARAHLHRLQRSAAAISLPAQRSELEPEIQALLPAVDRDAQLPRCQRGRRRIALIEPCRARRRQPGDRRLRDRRSSSPGWSRSRTRPTCTRPESRRAAAPTRRCCVRPRRHRAQAPTSTIFWVSGDELRTGPHAGILDSITRRAVIEALEVDRGRVPSWTCSAPRGLPGLDRSRGPAGLEGSTRTSSSRGRGRPGREPSTRAVGAKLGTEAVAVIESPTSSA